MGFFHTNYAITILLVSSTQGDSLSSSLSSLLGPGVEGHHVAWGGVALGVALTAWLAPSCWEWYTLRQKRQAKRRTCRLAIQDLRRRLKVSKVCK